MTDTATSPMEANVPPACADPPGRQTEPPTAGAGARPLSKWKLAALGLLLLASYAALLAATCLATSIALTPAIVVLLGLSTIAGIAFSVVSQALLAPLMLEPVRIAQIFMM
ncbi:MAG TPA: hypothetical protein VMB73_14000 [Acetobacteraceae bacterium]|jgi:hypothetical protein|nr:hypothetical protein [Acetobacteraceae bacterium]